MPHREIPSTEREKIVATAQRSTLPRHDNPTFEKTCEGTNTLPVFVSPLYGNGSEFAEGKCPICNGTFIYYVYGWKKAS